MTPLEAPTAAATPAREQSLCVPGWNSLISPWSGAWSGGFRHQRLQRRAERVAPPQRLGVGPTLHGHAWQQNETTRTVSTPPTLQERHPPHERHRAQPAENDSRRGSPILAAAAPPRPRVAGTVAFRGDACWRGWRPRRSRFVAVGRRGLFDLVDVDPPDLACGDDDLSRGDPLAPFIGP